MGVMENEGACGGCDEMWERYGKVYGVSVKRAAKCIGVWGKVNRYVGSVG